MVSAKNDQLNIFEPMKSDPLLTPNVKKWKPNTIPKLGSNIEISTLQIWIFPESFGNIYVYIWLLRWYHFTLEKTEQKLLREKNFVNQAFCFKQCILLRKSMSLSKASGCLLKKYLSEIRYGQNPSPSKLNYRLIVAQLTCTVSSKVCFRHDFQTLVVIWK